MNGVLWMGEGSSPAFCVSAAFPGQGINGISEVVVSCLVFTGVDKVIVCRGVYNCLVLAREI